MYRSKREQWSVDQQRLATLDIPSSLNRRPAQLFLLLLDHVPHWVSESVIRDRLFEGVCSRVAVRQLIRRTREQLVESGYAIESRRGFGQIRLIGELGELSEDEIAQHHRLNRDCAAMLAASLGARTA